MPDEQMLQHRVEAFVFFAIQFGVFVERDVFGPANSLYLAADVDSIAL